jgi:hypothetical protein
MSIPFSRSFDDLLNASFSSSSSSESLAAAPRAALPDNWQLPVEELSLWTEFRVLFLTSAAHTSASLLNGFGAPDTGDELTASAGVFQDSSEFLGSAGSDPAWQGPAAQSYDERNIEQQNRSNQMALLDTELANLLQTQAAQVIKLRNAMYVITGTLAAAWPVAWQLYVQPIAGPAVSKWFQIGTAIAVLGADIGLQTEQGFRSQQTGAAMEKLAASYTQFDHAAQTLSPLH